MMNPATKRLLEDAVEAGGLGTTEEYEPAYERLLSHLNDLAPAELAVFRAAFVELVKEGKLPWDLIAFMMHTLRWPEVLAVCTALAESKSPRVAEYHELIIGSFDPEWEYGDIFERYRTEQENKDK